jgi:hypothetical protein
MGWALRVLEVGRFVRLSLSEVAHTVRDHFAWPLQNAIDVELGSIVSPVG